MSSKAYFRWPINLVFAALVLTSHSCSLGLGGHASPLPPRIEARSRAAHSLEALWQAARRGADDGELTLIINERQLNSYLALRVAEVDAPIAVDPQVFLRSGSFQFHGTARGGPFTASVLFALSPQMDSDGNISLDLTKTELGPFVVSESIRNSVSAVLTEALTGKLGSIATGIRINTIAISDGEMAIIGTLR